MRSGSAISRDELEELAQQYRHLRAERRHARAGSRVRRHLRARMDELSRRFERLLAEAVPDAEERRRWQAHFHHAASEPATPRAAPALLFRGRSRNGSTAEILQRADGTLDVLVDGVRVERLESAEELLTTRPRLSLRLGNVRYDERFGASRRALTALRSMLEPDGAAPYGHARALLLDGLIDRNFGLTPRGRRALGLDRYSAVGRR